MSDLMTDPFEYSFDGLADWENWVMERAFMILPAVDKVAADMSTYRELPPRQRPASFSIDQVMEKVGPAMKMK